MSSIALPNTIVNDSALDATEVQENFAEIESYINSDTVKADGTTAMTAALSLVAVDPTTANQATRKSYVDAGVAAEAALRVTGDLGGPRVGMAATRQAVQSIPDNTLTAVVWDTQITDSDAYFAPTSATVTIPAGRAGLYVLSWNIYWPSNTATMLTVYVNAVATSSTGLSSSFLPVQSMTCVLALVVGDALTFGVQQSTGGAKNITASLFVNRISL